jgi:aminoglycoside phosphotransferase
VLPDMPGWPEIAARLTRELGEPVRAAQPLTPRKQSRMTWAARAGRTGELVVKIRYGDRAAEKTQWCAAHLPPLAARGYPVPAIRWHGLLDDKWHVMVQNRLPGRPLTSLDGPLLDEALRLVERQADAGLPAGPRDFTGYVANVLFDDWDEVWADAARACPAGGPLCARVRRWLRPVWGLRLRPTDYANNDLNLSNILTDGRQLTGVVDWDEFGLGSRALDLTTLAFDCTGLGDYAAADRLLDRAAEIAGPDGLRCLVSYQALAGLAYWTRENDPTAAAAEATVIAAVLDQVDAAR